MPASKANPLMVLKALWRRVVQVRLGSIVVERVAQATCITKVSKVDSSVLAGQEEGGRSNRGRLVACFGSLLDMAKPCFRSSERTRI